MCGYYFQELNIAGILLHNAPLDEQRKTRRYIKIRFIFLIFDDDDCV